MDRQQRRGTPRLSSSYEQARGSHAAAARHTDTPRNADASRYSLQQSREVCTDTPSPARSYLREVLTRVGAGVAGVLVLLVLCELIASLVLSERSCSRAGSETSGTTEPFVRSVALVPATQAQPDSETGEPTEAKPAYLLYDEGRSTKTGENRVSFCAVGDNLINANLLELVAAWSPLGADGKQTYDFHPLYEHIKPYIQDSYDIAFINQETVMGGTDYFDYTGYPSYNTPESMAQALYDTGWRVVNNNSNHTYDIWTPAIEHQQKLWKEQYPTVASIGSYESESDYQTPRVFECNGVRIAFLSYSYGQNGYTLDDLPNYYYATWWDEDRMKADVVRAREVADAVVVYLHAGTEYTHEPSAEQRAWAQACAEANVDLVIGSHVHWIQSLEWLKRADGGQMLAVYGLGDFVSGYHNNPECIMSGMFSCDFVKVEAGEEQSGDESANTSSASGNDSAHEETQLYPTGIKVENIVWHPVIEHWEGDSDTVYLLSDYSPELAATNELLEGLDDPYQWIVDTTSDVVGDVVSIDWGDEAAE